MAKRRGDGEGTIAKRPDGRWHGRIWVDGQRVHVYGRTRIEAQDALRRARNRLDEGRPPTDDATTVAEFLRWWAAAVLPRDKRVRDTTAYGYRRIIENRIVPAIGRHRLGRLAPAHVHAMLAELEDAGLAVKTRRNVHVVLRRALAHAERWELVTRNVASLVDPPRGSVKKTDDALELDDVKRLLAAATGDRLEALWVVAVTAGLRKGEALALTWADVDLDGAAVTVRGTLRRVPGAGLVVNAPKSERGARVVALPPVVVDAFRRRRQAQRLERLASGPRWTDTGYVFTTEVGTPIDPDNLQRAWRKVTARAGIGPLRFHALRHTAATVALGRGRAARGHFAPARARRLCDHRRRVCTRRPRGAARRRRYVASGDRRAVGIGR